LKQTNHLDKNGNGRGTIEEFKTAELLYSI